MKIFTVLLIVTCIFSFPAAGEEAYEKNRFSIGIDDVPWSISQVSLRWWRGEKKGSEFTIGYFNATHAEYDFSDDGSFSVGLLRFDTLRRKKSTKLRGLYYTRGFGISVGFNGEFLSKYNDFERIYANTTLYLPIGFEHFFIPKYPKLSYSLQADIYSRLSCYYQKYTSAGQSVETTEWQVRVGLKIEFFLRLYLK